MCTVQSLVRCIVVTVALCLAPSPSPAQDQAMADAMSVPPNVDSAEAGGYWSHDGAEGFFRTVMLAAGAERVGHRLFIQWIAVSSETQDYRLVRTVNVEEFGEGHGVTLELASDFSIFDKLTVSITATPVHGSDAQRYVLTATKEGTYRLTQE